MPKQGDLFGGQDERYGPFEGFPDDYPFGTFETQHPAFTRRASVVSGINHKRKYKVDLKIGECDCQKGWAWNWDAKGKKWYRNAICTHKLRVMCEIIEHAGGQPETTPVQMGELRQAYLKALGTRYNPFEAVSAFHKKLRQGDFEEAWFWGLMLANKRGTKGVIYYMLNIIYEETRDHHLAEHLIKVLNGGQRVLTLASLAQCIAWFCASRKKWEMPHRLDIFTAEMRGYEKLGKKYGWAVAKGGNIIDAGEKKHLLDSMKMGFKKRDLVMIQYGLKGLQKLQYDPGVERPSDDKLQEYRYWLYEQLYDIASELLPDEHEAWTVVSTVNQRIEARHGIGYHELNAIADAIAGESAAAGLLSPKAEKIVRNRPAPAIPLGKWPAIPLEAHDNHTWGGKRLMQRFPEQLKPQAVQSDLDFRWCGAYFGVCYRMVSYSQHGRVAEWDKVKWPNELHRIVSALWY